MLNIISTLNIPESVHVVLAVISLTFGCWLLTFLVDLGFVLTFKGILSKHIKSLTLFETTKYLNLKKIFNRLKENGVSIEPKIEEILSYLNEKSFDVHHTELAETNRSYLSYLGEEARRLILKNKSLFDDAEGEIISANLKDIEIQLRTNIACYNADVLGFNYWIEFLPTRFVYKLLKIKKKELIS